MYTEIGEVSEATIADLLTILPIIPKWQLFEGKPGQVNQMAACMEWAKEIPELAERWPIETWEQSIFLRLRPGDHLFNHVDSVAPKFSDRWGITIPMETNDLAVSFSSETEDGPQCEHRLEVGKAYLSDRARWHEAFNEGLTDRTNFVLILKEASNGSTIGR